MKRISFYPVLSVLLLLVAHAHASAGIRPSFHLETCSWNATDIVVATEGKKIDGVFRVLESWKGDLNASDTIKIPALAAFESATSRSVSDPWYQKEKSPHLLVNGDRVILFLKRDANAPQPADGSVLPAASIKWRSANFYDQMNVSVVWIEQGQTFGFVQPMNPGPSLLIRLGQSEDEFRQKLSDVLATQTSVLQATAVKDPEKRAEALAAFAHHSVYKARVAAFEGLQKTGPAALPSLRIMLADDSLADIHSSLVRVLAEAGKNLAGPELVGLLERDLSFWKQTGPQLEIGWWNGKGLSALEDSEPLRNRYMKDYEALQALKKRPYRESEGLLKEFRDYWRSLPQLGDVDQITKTCDEALAELERLKASRNAVRFEGLRSFGHSDLLRVVRETVSTEGTLQFTPEMADKAKSAIQDYLRSKGHIHATVSTEIDASSRALNIIIDEGERVGIADIRFEGNEVFSSQLLASQMKQCLSEYDSEGYDAEVFDLCLRDLHHFVRSKGYLQAKFNEPEKKETDEGLLFTIRADEGFLYRLGKMTIEGSSFFLPEHISSAVGLRKGDVANGEKIGKALFEDLKQQYAANGYIHYTAEVIPTFRKSGENSVEGVVDFEITIDEGKQFKLRSIKFMDSELPQKQLRDLLLIKDGDVFNQRLYDQWAEKLNDGALLESIDWDRDVEFNTDVERGIIDIVIKLKKGRNEGNQQSNSALNRVLVQFETP